MSKQTVQLLAVGFSARWLLESGVRADLRCHAIDFFEDADARGIGPISKVSSWRALPHLAKSLTPEAIIVGSGFETQPRVVNELRRVAPLLNSSAASCLASRLPGRWSECLRSCGLIVPRMFSQQTISERKEELHSSDWLVKNGYTAGGLGVREWNHGETCIQGSNTLSSGEYLQQRIDGRPHSLLFWLEPNRRLCLGFFRQLSGEAALGARKFQFAGAIGPLPCNRHQTALFQRVADQLSGDLGLSGLVGIDVLDSPAGLVAIEINPRPTATAELWERAQGNQSLIGKLWKAHKGEDIGELNPCVANQSLEGKAIIYWRDSQSLTVNSSHAAILDRLHREGWIKDIPSEGSSIDPGMPVATVFASGDSIDAVRIELIKRAAFLRNALNRNDVSASPY